MSFRPRLLLISGVDSVGSARLPSLFSEGGYDVHLVGSDRLAASRSKSVVNRIWSEPGPPGAARAARALLQSHRSDYQAIVLADEPTLWAALDDEVPPGEPSASSSHPASNPHAWLRDWFPVPLTAQYLDRLRFKTIFLRDSREAAITTPAFEICDTEAEVLRAAESLGYPVFVKATRGWAGSGLIFARSREDLESQLPNVSFEGSVLIQQEVTGQPGSLSVLYREGVPVCWFAYLMTRTWPNRFSSACRIQLFPHPAAGPLAAAVGKLTGFSGLAGIDFVWNPERNCLALLEFNPRPTPVYHLGAKAGVDFGQALRQIAAGQGVPQNPNASDAVIDIFPQALYSAVDNCEPRTFARSLRDVPWSDTGLTTACFRRFLTHYIPQPIKARLKR